ncbi:MAG: hypothetical protein ACREXS_21100 [Gammaproteobacteria bacterium]
MIARLLVTVAKLSRPGGLRAVAAESFAIKQQLLIAHQRAPTLTLWERLVNHLPQVFTIFAGNAIVMGSLPHQSARDLDFAYLFR